MTSNQIKSNIYFILSIDSALSIFIFFINTRDIVDIFGFINKTIYYCLFYYFFDKFWSLLIPSLNVCRISSIYYIHVKYGH